MPGVVSSVQSTAKDGTTLHGWLVMPKDASAEKPVPLVLWIHGGPFNSWNAWSWRWCPHLLAEHGYAVLLPDPALSTGYGQKFIQRAWGVWGDVVMNDVFTVLDDVLARPDIDPTRVAEMGGSFGGYMSNWVAGHTDRFRAIITHASLWSLDNFQATTDRPDFWEHQFGSRREFPERYRAASPDESISDVRTPVLVIHGNLDYRVPISEALQLWTDLRRHDVPSQYLYFPDENHWVLKPGNAMVWYQTVFAFLDHHMLDKDWKRPELL
jgi:dipeptidyl aminopeptidase/acylaminoacyl peptidase